ncbi:MULTISPECIES: NPP1 family protein [unclassified Streptomyces]|uniref:NPP1 family protein n=1 Tax=unclassified Streptomyces TaxID=2593676 RepID=UPI00070F8631|nr:MULTISPECIES: NPP1 family protein [unclassified Streptomyces]KRD21048.1 necrosis inducing protein (NPP1) [Streptomyces sp. Root264]
MPRTSRTSRLARTTTVAGSALALTVTLSGSASAGVLQNLPENATTFQTYFEPVYDYDTDSCYPAAAIDPAGNLNGGLKPTGSVTGQCRGGHLDHANTYSRAKCNNGWCGIIYASYFEKDEASPGIGHRHDWECMVVWVVQGADTPSYLSASRHGGFSTHPIADVPMSGRRVMAVYHKDGASTHAFRFAEWGETAENDTGAWHQENLLTWDNLAPNLRNALNGSDWGNANLPLQDSKFNDTLNKAKPSGIPFDPYA